VFKTITDQQQISRNLEQIRIAIEIDIVPLIDQTFLAVFKTITDQQQISRNLEQIRIAIEIDIVPFFFEWKKSLLLKLFKVYTTQHYVL